MKGRVRRRRRSHEKSPNSWNLWKRSFGCFSSVKPLRANLPQAVRNPVLYRATNRPAGSRNNAQSEASSGVASLPRFINDRAVRMWRSFKDDVHDRLFRRGFSERVARRLVSFFPSPPLGKAPLQKPLRVLRCFHAANDRDGFHFRLCRRRQYRVPKFPK